jgi:predicted nucleic acid-binding protein
MLEQSIKGGHDSRVLMAALDPGETEALCLALEVTPRFILVDERPTRRVAKQLNLPVIGTLGVLLRAKEHGLLTAIQPSLDALVTVEFYVTAGLYDRVLVDAGEAPGSLLVE